MFRWSITLLHGVRLGAGLAICLFLPTLMIAQLDRSHPPEPGPPPQVRLGDYDSFTLSNGMRVIVVENRKLPLVGVQVRFDVPPVLQGDKTGYVDIMGDLLAAGTGLRSKVQIDEQIDQLGAHLMTANDGVFVSGLKRHLPAMLEIVQDVVTNSTFPDKELERALTRYRSSVLQRRDDPDAISEAVGRAVTFSRTHPYGEVMTEKSLSAIRREHINGYYKRFFRPDAGYLVFVGDITVKEAKSLAKKHFNDWKVAVETTMTADGAEIVPGLGEVRYLHEPMVPSGQRRVVMVDRPGAAQSVIRVSYPLHLHPRDMRTMSAQVMNTILGGGVFNARLMQNLRENKAFTYGAYSNLEIDRYNGSFTASVSVRTDVTDSAIVEIINELEKMRNTPVTEEELELAKNYMAGSFARSLEDPRTVARFALNTFLYELPKDHYATYLKRLEAIGPKDVETAARDFLHPDHATIFVVGDRSQIGHKLPALASNPQTPLMVLDENGEQYQENLRPITDKNGQDVIDNYLNAIGGRSVLEKIRSMYTGMTANIGGMDLTIEQWQGPDGKFRSETSAEKMGVLQELIFDGERAVNRSPQGAQELTDADLLDVMAGAPPVPELRIDEFVERKTLGGITELGEQKVYKVVMATLAGTTVSDYYSVDTGLRVRRVDQKSIMGRPASISTDYEDYREVGGIKIPHRIRQTGGPMGEMVIEVTKVELNKDVPPGHFSTGLPPPGTQED